MLISCIAVECYRILSLRIAIYNESFGRTVSNLDGQHVGLVIL